MIGPMQILLWSAILLALGLMIDWIIKKFWSGRPRLIRAIVVGVLGAFLFWLSIEGYQSRGIAPDQSWVLAAVLAGSATLIAVIIAMLVGNAKSARSQK